MLNMTLKSPLVKHLLRSVEPFSPVRFGPVWLLPPCGVLSALACACALRLALGLLFLPCFGLLSCVVHTFTLCPDRFSCVPFSCVRPSLFFLPSAIASPCLACHLPLRVHILALLSPNLGSKMVAPVPMGHSIQASTIFQGLSRL